MPDKSSALLERLQAIPDPRRQWQNLKHRLQDILVLGFCGVVAGCDDFVERAAWARHHQDFFRTFLELPKGVPAHDTFTPVFAMVHAPALQGILLGSPLGEWAGLLTLVLVLRVVTCLQTGAETIEVRHFISSLRPSARRLGRAIRGHWSRENGLHWVLDVVFGEDGRRLYDRTAAENAAFLNRVAVSLLRADPSRSSLKGKRKQAGWDIHYLAQLLGLPSP